MLRGRGKHLYHTRSIMITSYQHIYSNRSDYYAYERIIFKEMTMFKFIASSKEKLEKIFHNFNNTDIRIIIVDIFKILVNESYFILARNHKIII